MPTTFLLRGGRFIDPSTSSDEGRDILIIDGRIEKTGLALAAPQGCEVVDLKGKVVAPGFMDMHVHLREPGFEHKETIETGTMSAAYGGFTAVCCMPNTNPAIDDESIVRFVQSQGNAANGGIVDVHPVGAVTKGRAGKELSAIAELVQAGAVGLSDDGAPVYDAEIMRRALEYAGMFRVPVIQHCEEPTLFHGGVMNEGFVSTELGLPGIPPVAEEIMISRDILLTEYTGALYHVAHMSTAGSVRLVREAKKKGIRITCEVTPHHFSLSDDAVRSFDTNTKMNPPLRTQRDIEAIFEGLRDGTVDVIASDHAPHSLDEKEVDYLQAPFGIVGLETAVGLAMTGLVHTGVITLPQLIAKFSTNPRRIVGREIKVAEGVPANLTFIDPEMPWQVSTASFKSKSKNSPFDGRQLKGKAIGIFNHGKLLLT
ncbi:MAG TPA: dihydroorotase [Bacteroidota bacterium]|nr:dihydroorotase [Bacteroidota bacterium]